MASIKGKPSFAASRRAKSGTRSRCFNEGTQHTQVGSGCGFQRWRTISAHASTSSSLKRPVFFSCATCFPHPESPQRERIRPVDPCKPAGKFPLNPYCVKAPDATCLLRFNGRSACLINKFAVCSNQLYISGDNNGC